MEKKDSVSNCCLIRELTKSVNAPDQSPNMEKRFLMVGLLNIEIDF